MTRAPRLAISPGPAGDITTALRGVMENFGSTNFENAFAREPFRVARDPTTIADWILPNLGKHNAPFSE
jgi:hypothetical protein